MKAADHHPDAYLDYVAIENRARVARAIALRDFVKRLRGQH